MTWTGRGGQYIPVSVRRAVLQRSGGLCELRCSPDCHGVGCQYDHVVSLKSQGLERSDRRASADASQLLYVCVPCHRQKTQAQAMEGRRRNCPKNTEADHRIGRVKLPDGWQYAPR